MSLPTIPLPAEVVQLSAGDPVPIRSLTREETFHLSAMKRQDLDALTPAEAEAVTTEAEVYIIACGTDTPEADVRAWRAVTPSPDVDALLSAIGRLSRLSGRGTDGKDADPQA
jgi:hypothetical protein